MNLPTHTHPGLTPARVRAVLARLHGRIWRTDAPIAQIAATQTSASHLTFAQARRLPLRSVRKPPFHWGRRLWEQRWFWLRLPRPAAKGDFLEWQDQAEATLYVGGLPHYGFDVAHRFSPLPRGAREVWIESMLCQSAIWHPAATGLDPRGSRCEGARLVTRDESVWCAWNDLAALVDLMELLLRREYPGEEGLHQPAVLFDAVGVRPRLNRVSPLLRRLLRWLELACDAADTAGPAAVSDVLRRAYRDLPADGVALTAALTGHAHIDLVWLWPERAGEFKAVHTFATQLSLLDRYPEFRFAYSQTASYAAVGRRSPALLRAVRRRIATGRWEAAGALEVESDTILPCGEALARSFLLGQEGFKTLTGAPSRLLWLPDVFGYSACLPQLMRECGVDWFFTTKLAWNAITPFPHSSFVWRGHDGSEVLAHLTHDNGYNQAVAARELDRGARAYRQADSHDTFLAPTGWGDGGGGPTEEMCERARRFTNLAGLPRARWTSLTDYYTGLEKIRRDLPRHAGELYFEYHRGTYTTHGQVKSALRAAERALQTREAVRCALGRKPIDPQAWRRVVFAQFHDYIPGSSVREVYEEGVPELREIARDALANATRELSSGEQAALALFNPLPRSRACWISPKRRVVLPPLGGGPVRALTDAPACHPVQISLVRLANERVDARFNARGEITRLVFDGRVVPLSAPAAQIWIHTDKPHSFDAWDIDYPALCLGKRVASPARVAIESVRDDGATLAFTRRLTPRSTATVRYTLAADDTALRVTVDLDWHEESALLKFTLPTRHQGKFARFAAPFGSVLRPQLPGSLEDDAKWEVPASRWAVVCDEGERAGLAVITEAKYGFSCRDGHLGLSLVRSAVASGELGRDMAAAPAAFRAPSPGAFSDQGRHTIHLALAAYSATAPRDEQPGALADLLFTSPIAYRGPANTAGLLGIEGGNTLQPVWAKPANDGRGWILRLNESLGQRGTARLRLAPGLTARRVDLREQPISGSGTKIDYEPHALVSVRIAR